MAKKELILIPAGWFTMGSNREQDQDAPDNELPQHKVYVSEFYIAKYPVTNAEYKRFVDATGHSTSESFQKYFDLLGKADHPVVQVSWYDANAYCQWLSRMTGRPYRLPTEAEWEKAARGTDGRIYPWGNTFNSARCNSWESMMTEDASERGTTPVNHYPSGATPYGVMDMAGNVWEWCHSLYKPYPYDPGDGREDPKAEDPRGLRGGSFLDDQWGIRCACRLRLGPDLRYYYDGFRICVVSQ